MSADSKQPIFPLRHLLLLLLLLFLFPLLEPPEAYVDNEHDEKDTSSCQLGIGGAGIQILGVASVLFRQAGQVAGLGVECCEEEKAEGEKKKVKGGWEGAG